MTRGHSASNQSAQLLCMADNHSAAAYSLYFGLCLHDSHYNDHPAKFASTTVTNLSSTSPSTIILNECHTQTDQQGHAWDQHSSNSNSTKHWMASWWNRQGACSSVPRTYSSQAINIPWHQQSVTHVISQTTAYWLKQLHYVSSALWSMVIITVYANSQNPLCNFIAPCPDRYSFLFTKYPYLHFSLFLITICTRLFKYLK